MWDRCCFHPNFFKSETLECLLFKAVNGLRRAPFCFYQLPRTVYSRVGEKHFWKYPLSYKRHLEETWEYRFAISRNETLYLHIYIHKYDSKSWKVKVKCTRNKLKQRSFLFPVWGDNHECLRLDMCGYPFVLWCVFTTCVIPGICLLKFIPPPKGGYRWYKGGLHKIEGKNFYPTTPLPLMRNIGGEQMINKLQGLTLDTSLCKHEGRCYVWKVDSTYGKIKP